MIEEGEESGFINSNTSTADAAISKCLRGEFCGAFVFLPDADFCGEAKLLAKTAFFKRGADKEWVPRARKKKREEPLAGPPMNSSEV